MLSASIAPDSPGAVLRLVRTGQVASRSEIARLTHISASTAANRVQALIDLGLLQEVGAGKSRGGRRPRRLDLRGEAGVVAAADLGASHAVLALFDIAGNLLTHHDSSISIAQGPDVVLAWVFERVQRMLAEPAARRPLLGLTIGVPGPVDSRTGRVVTPSRMPGWNGADVPALLAEYTDVPVLVENDANLLAVGEYFVGDDTGEHLVVVKAGSGIGCGVIASGSLHRGAIGAAGDISHVSVGSRTDILCSCGRIGCLDAVASGAALAREMRDAGLPAADTAAVVDLARNAEPVSARILRDAGRAIGEVLATVVNFFNPNTLMLCGQLSQAEPYFASFRSALYERCLPMAVENLRIAVSSAGPLAGVIGGGHLMLEHLFHPARINALASEAVGTLSS